MCINHHRRILKIKPLLILVDGGEKIPAKPGKESGLDPELRSACKSRRPHLCFQPTHKPGSDEPPHGHLPIIPHHSEPGVSKEKKCYGHQGPFAVIFVRAVSCPLELGKAAGVVTSRVQIWGADTKMACVRNHGVVIPLAVFETDDVPPLFFVYEGQSTTELFFDSHVVY